MAAPATVPPPRRRRALVIHNPTAGGRRRAVLAEVVEALRRRGMTVDIQPTTGPGDATTLAAAASRARHDVVCAAGGDGTINEVANGLLRADDPPPLAVIPLGTANVLAIELGLPAAPDALAALIADGGEAAVHPAVADDRAFLLMAGAGFDAAVVHGVRRPVKRLLGKGAYVLQTLIETLRYRFPPLTVRADGREFTARMVVACKGRHYGGPYVAAPEARLEAGSVQLCLFHGGGVVAQARYGLALLRGRVATLPDVTVIEAREVTITAPAATAPVPVQVDGDAEAALPLHITMAARPLAVISPQAAPVTAPCPAPTVAAA